MWLRYARLFVIALFIWVAVLGFRSGSWRIVIVPFLALGALMLVQTKLRTAYPEFGPKLGASLVTLFVAYNLYLSVPPLRSWLASQFPQTTDEAGRLKRGADLNTAEKLDAAAAEVAAREALHAYLLRKEDIVGQQIETELDRLNAKRQQGTFGPEDEKSEQEVLRKYQKLVADREELQRVIVGSPDEPSPPKQIPSESATASKSAAPKKAMNSPVQTGGEDSTKQAQSSVDAVSLAPQQRTERDVGTVPAIPTACTASRTSSGTVALDPPEYNAYANAIVQSDPSSQAEALEKFLRTYPQSAARETALCRLIDAYIRSQQFDQARTAIRAVNKSFSNLNRTSQPTIQDVAATVPATPRNLKPDASFDNGDFHIALSKCARSGSQVRCSGTTEISTETPAYKGSDGTVLLVFHKFAVSDENAIPYTASAGSLDDARCMGTGYCWRKITPGIPISFSFIVDHVDKAANTLNVVMPNNQGQNAVFRAVPIQ